MGRAFRQEDHGYQEAMLETVRPENFGLYGDEAKRARRFAAVIAQQVEIRTRAMDQLAFLIQTAESVLGIEVPLQ